MLHLFVTSNSFFDNKVSKTYFKLSNTFIYLIDLNNTETIDFFFKFHQLAVDQNVDPKVTLIIKALSKRGSKISDEMNFRGSLISSSKRRSMSGHKVLSCQIQRLKAFIKVHKIVTLYFSDFAEISTKNLTFQNFLGFHILKKMKKVNKCKREEKNQQTKKNPILDTRKKSYN